MRHLATSRRAFTLIALPAARRREASGFTLIELLVVVAIIVALLAILMPSMGKAIEQAQRTVCATQLSQLTSAATVYAADHFGRVPIGHANDKYQFNYLLYRNDGVKDHTAMGLLYKSKILIDPMVNYCPSTPASNFDTSFNPWLTRQPTGVMSNHTRSDYGNRPVVNWEQSGGEQAPDGKFPTLRSLGSAAALADLFTQESSVDTRHRDGVNSASIDGSVAWVARTHFQSAMDQFANVFDTVNNAAQLEVWRTLDRRP